MYWADLWFSFLFFLSFISWERERRDISTSWKPLLGAMKHGESYPTEIIFSLVSPNLTCHQLAPQNLKWLRKSMKKASVWSPGLQRPQSLNYISWTYALFKALTTEEQRKQSGFSLQETDVHMAWFLHVTQFSKQLHRDPQLLLLLPVPRSFPQAPSTLTYSASGEWPRHSGSSGSNPNSEGLTDKRE